MLIILGGLPGTGKSTIAKQLAKQLNAVYIRIDTIEQALKQARNCEIEGPEGYLVGYALAADNLRLGLHVIADSVNPIAITRHAWQKVAQEAHVKFIEIELFCSNAITHQNRVETRKADIKGHCLPSWEDVLTRDYESWESKSISIDTSSHSVDQSIRIILGKLESYLNTSVNGS